MSLKISNLPKGSLDIVKALREAESVLATEAADEIERLRAELAALRAELATERERADARRKTVSMLCRENAEMEADRDKAEAERDALRALLREAFPYRHAVSWPSDLIARIDAALNKG